MADTTNSAPRADGLYGQMAEFRTPQKLLDAIHAAQEAGYTALDAYTPYPVEEVNHAICPKRSKVPLLVLIAGLTGAAVGFFLQYWTAGIDYPVNIGGRPLNSWPAFIPVTFETTVLFAAFTSAISMLALNGLPQPYHPVFNVERFERALQDRCFLVIESRDPKFNREKTAAFLRGLGPDEVFDVDG